MKVDDVSNFVTSCLEEKEKRAANRKTAEKKRPLIGEGCEREAINRNLIQLREAVRDPFDPVPFLIADHPHCQIVGIVS